jgi:hypothetical protein
LAFAGLGPHDFHPTPVELAIERRPFPDRIESMTTLTELAQEIFDPPLDAGIFAAVLALRSHDVETFESCEGGAGHAYPEPTVRFHGDTSEGFRALAAAMKEGLPVAELRRVWPIQDEEPTGPWWEITFVGAPPTIGLIVSGSTLAPANPALERLADRGNRLGLAFLFAPRGSDGWKPAGPEGHNACRNSLAATKGPRKAAREAVPRCRVVATRVLRTEPTVSVCVELRACHSQKAGPVGCSENNRARAELTTSRLATIAR